MVTRVATVAFEGIEARAVDAQVQVTPGGVNFMLVGLPDKAVGESKKRVRSALISLTGRQGTRSFLSTLGTRLENTPSCGRCREGRLP
jgi:hypothetical protein